MPLDYKREFIFIRKKIFPKLCFIKLFIAFMLSAFIFIYLCGLDF
jgi:hypothetical protein